MVSRRLSTPAFGQADLSNCEREQIHLAGSIQPHGVLLLLREPDLVVVQASTNAASQLGSNETVLGRSLATIAPDLDSQIRLFRNEPLHSTPIAGIQEARSPN